MDSEVAYQNEGLSGLHRPSRMAAAHKSVPGGSFQIFTLPEHFLSTTKRYLRSFSSHTLGTPLHSDFLPSLCMQTAVMKQKKRQDHHMKTEYIVKLHIHRSLDLVSMLCYTASHSYLEAETTVLKIIEV